jgi:superfamily I DNA/RNA helicase
MVSASKTKTYSLTNKQQFETEELEIKFILERVRNLIYVEKVSPKNIAILFRIYNGSHFVERICEGLALLGLPYSTKSDSYKEFKHLKMLFDILELLVAGWGSNVATINFLKSYFELSISRATELSNIPLPCEGADLTCHQLNILEQLESLLLLFKVTTMAIELFDDLVNLLRDIDPIQGTKIAKRESIIDFFNPMITKLRTDLGCSYVHPSDNAGEIFIGSIHSAKGKEWGFVFLPQLNEGTLPYYKNIQDFKTDEERRVLYVGITRAQRDCYISYSQQDLKGRQLFESSFIEHIIY